jgi:uncharacterized protein
MEIEIGHDEANGRFFCRIDGKECSVDYEMNGGSIPLAVDIVRTYVHPDLRGRGIAEALLKTLSEWVLRNGYVVIPSCSYAVTYYRRHPEHASAVSKTVDPENGGSCRLPGN